MGSQIIGIRNGLELYLDSSPAKKSPEVIISAHQEKSWTENKQLFLGPLKYWSHTGQMAILELESQVERESQLTQKHKSLLEPATSRDA